MDVQQILNGLLERLPKGVSAEELFARTPRLLPPVNITGALLGRRDDVILIKIGDATLQIKISDIISLKEHESEPAVQSAGVYVTLDVASSATVIETRARELSEIGKKVGSRPLVYDVPSQAAQYSIPDAQYRQQQERFFESSGLTSLLPGARLMGVEPRSLTSYETPQGTLVDTITQTPYDTGTPGDTHTDYSVDHTTDSQTDYVRDYRDDVS